MKRDILCSNTKRSVWLQNYNHLFPELLYKQKINRTPSAEDVKPYFVVLYLFNFIVKITQKCNKARSETGIRQEKSFVSKPHFQKTLSENNNSLKVFLDEFCYNIIQFVKIACESKTDNENNNANI